MGSDPTVDPQLRSWTRVSRTSPFPIQNLPFGVFSTPGSAPRVGVAIGDEVLDLAQLAAAGLLTIPGLDAYELFASRTLNRFMEAGPMVWTAVRRRVSALLSSRNTEILDEQGLVTRVLVSQGQVHMHLPFEVADYVDFYSSRHHAENVGRLFRPDEPPLLDNWLHLPVGYHSRSGTVVVSGTAVRRPSGQMRRGTAPPAFGPSRRLDFELEMGVVVGVGSEPGQPVPIDQVRSHIFGLVLVNDWSARDIQAFEYQPLGPFLGKSFATSISPWVITLDALAPYETAAQSQDPTPARYLARDHPTTYDIDMEVRLATAAARERGSRPERVTLTNFQELYWTIDQQLAHATVNGAHLRTGDLFASGTVSGPEPENWGSLLERSQNGSEPIPFRHGEKRTFLEDGDEVRMTAWAGSGIDQVRIGFGEVRGTVLPAERP